MSTKELRPCPLCGSENISIEYDYAIRCNRCELYLPWSATRALATGAWNKRTGNAEVLKAAGIMLEALEHIAEYWNGSETTGAMSDALAEIVATAQNAIAEADSIRTWAIEEQKTVHPSNDASC